MKVALFLQMKCLFMFYDLNQDITVKYWSLLFPFLLTQEQKLLAKVVSFKGFQLWYTEYSLKFFESLHTFHPCCKLWDGCRLQLWRYRKSIWDLLLNFLARDEGKCSTCKELGMQISLLLFIVIYFTAKVIPLWQHSIEIKQVFLEIWSYIFLFL